MIAAAPQLAVSRHGFAQVMKDTATGQQYLHSTKAFQPGEIICSFSPAAVFDTPSYLTVQTGDAVHITLSPSFLQYINHSCSPNAFFNTGAMQLECISPIAAGDQFTFFYPSTEWEMAQPFQCCCGTQACIGYIDGASALSPAVLERYQLTEYIMGKLKPAL